jgi:streptothricin acetyltransferase
MPTYRKMTPGDLIALDQIDPNFTSDTYLDVEMSNQAGVLMVSFTERPFATSFTKIEGYRYDTDQIEMTRYRLEQSKNALVMVAEQEGRLVGILEVEAEIWRNTALVWALFVDKQWRGQGVGAKLLREAEKWAKRKRFRAIVLETQTNNVPAIRFYEKHGYAISGFDRYFYSNQDIEKKEVAVFMYKIIA